MTQDSSSMAQINVEVSHSPLAFIYDFFTPTITINDKVYRERWGTHSFNVPAGHYEISVSYPWLFSRECGKNSVQVDVQVGESRTVTYSAGLIRYLPGKMSVK